MKITAIEIKPGMIIEHNNDYWNVLKTQHVKPGKGGAFNQVELKSVIKGTKLNERFRSSEAVEKVEVDEKAFEKAIERHEKNFEEELKNIDPNAVILKVKKALLEQARQNNSAYNATMDMKYIVNDLNRKVERYEAQVEGLEKELEEVRGLFTSAIKILDAMPKKPKKKGFWNFIKCLLK